MAATFFALAAGMAAAFFAPDYTREGELPPWEVAIHARKRNTTHKLELKKPSHGCAYLVFTNIALSLHAGTLVTSPAWMFVEMLSVSPSCYYVRPWFLSVDLEENH